ncbi:MAG: fumarylacetoacetate hydrolase family protein [Methylococcales bacterium]|nr:fumarylacetoacetate hydrolase family protein [Methylococcales bacterium]
MKLATFFYNNSSHLGAIVENEIFSCEGNPNTPDNIIDFINAGESAKLAMQKLINSGGKRIPLADIKLQAPVPRPGKFLGIALNYADHINETQLKKPEYPMFFTKQTTCVIGNNDAIHRPIVSEKLDYEGELAFVIGKYCRHVPAEKAHQVIAGYTIVNDVSVRDWQIRSPTWTLGKSFDTHGPMGPWIVTEDEIKDPHNLYIKTWVDEDLRQNSNTKHMIFNCYEIIEYLTKAMTLEPGDVIATGTPSGVGVKMKPRGYMKPGQRVKIEIEGIGILSNPVIEEPENSASQF